MAQIRKRELKSGKVSYEVRLHRAGFKPKSKSFEKLADARQWEKEVETSVNRSELVDQRKKKDTIGQVLSEFATEYKDRNGNKIGPDGHPNSPTYGHLKFPHPERVEMTG